MKPNIKEFIKQYAILHPTEDPIEDKDAQEVLERLFDDIHCALDLSIVNDQINASLFTILWDFEIDCTVTALYDVEQEPRRVARVMRVSLKVGLPLIDFSREFEKYIEDLIIN